MSGTTERFIYWLPASDFACARRRLARRGYTFVEARLTPCQVLGATGKTLVFASPKKWDGLCHRQGSWYRHSHRAGEYLVVSDHELCAMADFLDARLDVSDFTPEVLPDERELAEVVDGHAYRTHKPPGWEDVSRRESVLLKLFFSVTRFWRRGDSMATRWLGHRANHANFLSRRFTTKLDDEDVAYSVTDNAGVCSSCAEFFNVVGPNDRKLVRACPGSITFAGAQRDVYYDVRPVELRVSAGAARRRSA